MGQNVYVLYASGSNFTTVIAINFEADNLRNHWTWENKGSCLFLFFFVLAYTFFIIMYFHFRNQRSR